VGIHYQIEIISKILVRFAKTQPMDVPPQEYARSRRPVRTHSGLVSFVVPLSQPDTRTTAVLVDQPYSCGFEDAL
jgi:hypothetical protein